MSLQIRAIVGNDLVFLDLFQDEPVLMSISFAEIQNITSKNSAFSQTFQLPGTKVNNSVFDYYYDISSTPINFNPNNKFPAIITWDGVEIMQGNIRLDSVTINRDEITYTVVFYNQVGDVAANIGDKFMRQLDLSSLTHPLSDSVWVQSQIDYNLVPLTGATNYSYQDGRTFWGLYQIGYNYTNSLSGLTNYYIGASNTTVTISRGTKTITTSTVLPFIPGNTIRMLNVASGFYVEGNVTSANGTSITFDAEFGLGTGTFSTWVVFYVLPEGVQINDYDTTPQIAFQAPNVPNFFSFSGTPVRDFYFKPSIQVKELYTQIFNQAGYEVESEFFDTSYFERYYLPLKFNTQGVYSQGLVKPCYTFSFSANTPNSGVTCNNVPFSADSQAIYIPSGYSGSYTFDVYLTYEDYFPLCTGSPGYYELYLSANSTTYLVSQVQDCDPDFPGTYQIQLGGRITIDIVSPTTLSLYPVVGTGTITGAGLQIQNAPRFAPLTGNYDYSLEFPPNDFKQIDFITSINKLFNLVVVPSPNKPDVLIVEPIIDFIGKGQVLDWTSKFDVGSPIQLKPTNSLINGTLNFNFRLDQDFVNQQFNISANRVFGTYELQLNQDYKDAKTNFDPIFSSPVDITLNNANLPNITISNLTTVKTNEGSDGLVFQKFEPYKILPRVLFRGLTYPNDNWGINSGQTQTWWAETYQFDRWQEINRFTTYPFSYNNFSHYINWNSQDTFDANESVFTFQQDMYDVYYSEYINDLISNENKIVSGKIYLTPWEISQLRYDEKILIQNNYFRINKISNYNLTEPSICDIELIKLTKDYTPHPIMYYTFVACNPLFESLFTNSDLMFNLYAYIGRYVKVYTENKTYLGCFEVREDVYNPNRTYQHYWLTTGFTQSGVSIYEDCACTGRTSMLVVQEPPPVSPSPTPSVTPSITPSNTPTPSVTPTISLTPTNTPTHTPTQTQTPTPSVTPPTVCLCYFIFNETGGALDYDYTPCGSGTPTTVSLGAGASVRRCSSSVVTGAGLTITPCTSVTFCSADIDCDFCT